MNYFNGHIQTLQNSRFKYLHEFANSPFCLFQNRVGFNRGSLLENRVGYFQNRVGSNRKIKSVFFRTESVYLGSTRFAIKSELIYFRTDSVCNQTELILSPLPVHNFETNGTPYVMGDKTGFPRPSNIKCCSLDRSPFFHSHTKENVVWLWTLYLHTTLM